MGLDANLHPVPPTFSDPCAALKSTDAFGGSSGLAFNMARPLIRDTERHRQRRLEELTAHLEAAGPRALGTASANSALLLRVLPYVHVMLSASRGNHPRLRYLPFQFMHSVMELSAPIDGDLFRNGAQAADSQVASARSGDPAWDNTSLAEDPIEDG